MKCIHCGKDTKFSERKINRGCGNCGKAFAFEPTTDSLKITDPFFLRVIRDLSAQNKLSFTERQLWYEFNRRLAHKRWWGLPLKLAIVAVVSSLIWRDLWQVCLPLFGLPSLTIAVAGYLSHRRKLRFPAVTIEAFRSNYFRPWIQAHGPLEKLAPAEDNIASAISAIDEGFRDFYAPSLSAPEPDITAYSFDRALVTDSGKIAAMLVANNFHFENNCAILSIDGYPPGLAETVMTMLRRNPVLTIYALHNASTGGCRLPLTLRQPQWFPDSAIAIFDLGLLPRHLQKKHWLTLQGIPQSLPEEIRRLLTPEEIAWLEKGFQVELAVLRPARLMKAIYSGIGRSAQAKAGSEAGAGDGGDGGDIIWIHHSFDDADGGDGDGGFDASDSFG